MVRLFLFVFILFSAPSFAGDGISGFFTDVSSFFASIWFFITETIPATIYSFFTYLTAWAILLKFKLAYEALVYSYDVAIVFIDLISLNEMINVAVAGLPADVRNIAIDTGFFEGFTIILEALFTRLIYGMLH